MGREGHRRGAGRSEAAVSCAVTDGHIDGNEPDEAKWVRFAHFARDGTFWHIRTPSCASDSRNLWPCLQLRTFSRNWVRFVRFAHLMCAPDMEHSGTSPGLRFGRSSSLRDAPGRRAAQSRESLRDDLKLSSAYRTSTLRCNRAPVRHLARTEAPPLAKNAEDFTRFS
jgi:hypothetical protein